VCVELCEASGDCESVTFFSSKWCSHFSTICANLKQSYGAITITPEANMKWTLVGYGQECQGAQALVSSGKQENLAKCIASCDLESECKSVTFSTSKFCSHFSTACEKTQATAKAVSMASVTQQTKCDQNAGEIRRWPSSGLVSDLAACKKSCKDEPGCKSITYWAQWKYCGHFSTKCSKRAPALNAVSMRLKTDTIVASRDVNTIQITDQQCNSPKLSTSPGFVDSLAVCVELCEASGDCESVTFFSSKWCSHFSTICANLKQSYGAITITPEANMKWTLVGYGQECQGAQALVSSGKQENLAKCIASCDLESECKSVTFSTSKFCSHFSTACEKTQATAKAVSMASVTQQTKCDQNAGEIRRWPSSGLVSDLAACKKSCKDEPGCKSITYWAQWKYCGHFSTKCSKRAPALNTVSMRLKFD